MKKVFITADIEGVTGVTNWCETEYGNEGYDDACVQMTREVDAACRAAMELGYQVVVKDGHSSARNLKIGQLPKGVEVIRGWRVSPEGMMGGIDDSFDAVICIGYHSPAGMNSNPLAHTIDHHMIDAIHVNGQLASELSLNALYAAQYKVPTVFVSGDEGICQHSKEWIPDIETVAVKNCVGNSSWNLHPDDAVDQIYEGVKKALQAPAKLMEIPSDLHLEMTYTTHQGARNASWYPGAKLTDVKTVALDAASVMDMTIARVFMMSV